jgi:uncharacterized membrane protein YdbT with pleckstrin-like domain
MSMTGEAGVESAPAVEETLLTCHPVMFRANPLAFVGFLLLIPVVVGLIWLLVWWIKTRKTTLIVTSKRTTLVMGILSKKTDELRHNDVRSISVTQGFLQRVFGVGSIEISSAARSDAEIIANDIHNPQHVADLIRQRQE